MSRQGTMRWMISAALALSLAAPDDADARRRRKKRRRAKKAAATATLAPEAVKFEPMAKKAYLHRSYDDAIAGFELAYQADPHPKFLFNIRRCYEKKADLPNAMKWVTKYRAVAASDKDRGQADDLLAMLEVKLRKSRTQVNIVSSPPEAIVRLRGDQRSADGMVPFSRWMPFGVYELEVSLAGHETQRQQGNRIFGDAVPLRLVGLCPPRPRERRHALRVGDLRPRDHEARSFRGSGLVLARRGSVRA